MTKVEKIKARLCSMDWLQWRRTSQGFEARDREAMEDQVEKLDGRFKEDQAKC